MAALGQGGRLRFGGDCQNGGEMSLPGSSRLSSAGIQSRTSPSALPETTDVWPPKLRRSRAVTESAQHSLVNPGVWLSVHPTIVWFRFVTLVTALNLRATVRSSKKDAELRADRPVT